MKKLSLTQSIVVLLAAALFFIGIGFLALRSNEMSDSSPDFSRVEELLARETIDQDVEDFIVAEYFGYSDETRDRDELQNIIRLSAVMGFVRTTFQNEEFEILDERYSFEESSLSVRQYKFEIGDNTYFLSVGIDNEEKTRLIYLDDEQTDSSDMSQLENTNVGFEVIQNLTVEQPV